jgi:SPP1 family phage portal protein
MEELISNWGDTNDYFGSPSYFVSGTIEGFAEKGEQGRVYTGTEGADMKVLSWDSSPQSMNAELSTLTNIIFSYSQTPDISFESMKQLSGKTSGVAIKLMFTDPHMKASMKIEQFGEMFTRRCNIIKNGIVTTLKPIPPSYVDSLVIEPNFTPYAPKNDSELVNMIRIAVGDKPIMSQEDGIICNPLVSNPIETMDRIKRESQYDAQGVTNITVPAEGKQ